MSEGNGATAPTTDVTVNIPKYGIKFSIPARYTEGHPCTAAEAKTLNQTLAENLRNNFVSNVKERVEKNQAAAVAAGNTAMGDDSALSDTDKAELTSAFDEYATEYTFSESRRPRIAVDPIEREATKIAKAKVLEALRAQNIEAKSLPEGKMEQFVASVLAKYPSITEEAKRRVDAAKGLGANILADLGDVAQAPAQ